MENWFKAFAALAFAALIGHVSAAEAQPAGIPAAVESTVIQPQIDWFQGDVDAAFAAAREQGKPLFLYWGARWCPYCAQLESSVFVHPEFVTLSRRVVALRLDGDAANADALAKRFSVNGYPATLLFSADGDEIDRLPAGTFQVDAYLQALDLALASERSVKQHVQDLLDQNKTLDDRDWIRLARYTWYNDQERALGSRPIGATLLEFGARCPERIGEPCRTLKLSALAESAVDGTITTVVPSMLPLLRSVLSTPDHIREQSNFLSSEASNVLAAMVTAAPEQVDELRSLWRSALQQLASDDRLAPRERLLSQIALIDVERHATDELTESLINSTRALVADASALSVGPLARQAIVGAAAHALISIGDLEAADALLEEALSDSPAAYYLMGSLAHYAGRRGDAEAEWHWKRRAFEDGAGSDLPRVRLRTASSYFSYLIAKQPQQHGEILQVGIALASDLELNYGGGFWLAVIAGVVLAAFGAVLLSVSGGWVRVFTWLVLAAALLWLPLSIALAGNLGLNFATDLGGFWFAGVAALLLGVILALIAAIVARIASCFPSRRRR